MFSAQKPMTAVYTNLVNRIAHYPLLDADTVFAAYGSILRRGQGKTCEGTRVLHWLSPTFQQLSLLLDRSPICSAIFTSIHSRAYGTTLRARTTAKA